MMSRAIKERVTELTSLKDIEKQFTIIPKLFKNKESDLNWEERLTVIKLLRSILTSHLMNDHKENIIAGLRKELPVVIKSILSLRSSVASETLSLLSDVSQPLGHALDQYTVGLILDEMLKCSVNTKKMITLKLAEATEAFLTHTQFHVSVLNKLCKTRSEKSVQLRQYAGKSIKTILEVHATKDHVRSLMDANISTLEEFLKKGISDASPGVRDTCRSLYKSYYQLWPDHANSFFGSLDSPTQKQLCRSSSIAPKPISRSSTLSPSTSKTIRPPTPSPSSSKVISSRQPLVPLQPRPSSSSSSISKAPVGRSPTPTHNRLIAPMPSKSRLTTPTNRARLLAPALKPKVLPNSQSPTPSSSRLIHSKAIPKTPTPTASIVSQMKGKPITPITKQRSPRTSPVLSKPIKASIKPRLPRTSPLLSKPIKASIELTKKKPLPTSPPPPSAEEIAAKEASELHTMLKNENTQVRCQGIHLLSTRLKKMDYAPTSIYTSLPSDVPSKIDLLIILMDLITRKDLDTEVYEALMGWESIAGIFVYLMSLNYYCPTLIIASHQDHAGIQKIYSQGLIRVKMFLKRNDPLLPQRLLDILKSITGEQKLLDASVKKDLMVYPAYKQILQCGLLTWMNEILSDYVGLAEDEDTDILEQGTPWLHVNEGSSAEEWFDTAKNIKSYAEFVIETLVTTTHSDDTFPLLCQLARKLKLANPRVFSHETVGSPNEEHIEHVLLASGVPDQKMLARHAPFDDDLHVSKKQRQILT